MKSLKGNYKEWITSYEYSELFKCNERNNVCDLYHALTPVLYEIGLLQSYQSYDKLILKSISTIFPKTTFLNILVLGIDCEVSAKALIDILNLINEPYALTFLDCCSTPLNRIDASLEHNEKKFVKTRLIDILTPSIKELYSKYDIVFADSFLKQFNKPCKLEILQNISKLLINASSRVIIREYFGSNDNLLLPFWAKLKALEFSQQTTIKNYFSSIENFHLMTNQLDYFYRNTGNFYKNNKELQEDLIESNLLPIDNYIINGKSEVVITASLQSYLSL